MSHPKLTMDTTVKAVALVDITERATLGVGLVEVGTIVIHAMALEFLLEKIYPEPLMWSSKQEMMI